MRSTPRLRYVSLTEPGYARLRRGQGFVYRQPKGGPLVHPAELERIRRLAIPPAWSDVWICRTADGHIQAIGRDARGRRQYRYHPEWRAAREATKFDRLADFARALPAIRRQVAKDLRRPPLSHPAVVATVIRLLETTLIRVGNEEYARTNGSYGLTTLRNRHVKVRADQVRFHFRGKSGKTHEVAVQDRLVAARVRRLQDLPGQELFQYVDPDGKIRPVTSEDVNDYLHTAAHGPFSAKDFRTWAGTLAAAAALAALETPNGRLSKRQIAATIEGVAAQLGNTATICRKSYIHPALLECYATGRGPRPAAVVTTARRRAGLSPAEKSLVSFLRASARHPPSLRRQLAASLSSHEKKASHSHHRRRATRVSDSTPTS